jgi:hypothetical protein
MDTYTLHSAFLDSLRPPLRCAGGQPARLASPAAACYMCGEPLIEMEFRGHFALMCDNWRCILYRQSQGSRAKATTATWPVQAIGIFYRK